MLQECNKLRAGPILDSCWVWLSGALSFEKTFSVEKIKKMSV